VEGFRGLEVEGFRGGGVDGNTISGRLFHLKKDEVLAIFV
jgi:hypothetical protein